MLRILASYSANTRGNLKTSACLFIKSTISSHLVKNYTRNGIDNFEYSQRSRYLHHNNSLRQVIKPVDVQMFYLD